MKWNELIIIAEAHGYKHIKHGKKSTTAITMRK